MALYNAPESPLSSKQEEPSEQKIDSSSGPHFQIKNVFVPIINIASSFRSLFLRLKEAKKRIQDSNVYSHYLPHAAIVFLILTVVVSNVSERAAALNLTSELVSIDPDDEYQITDSIDIYTPEIAGDAAVIEKSNELAARAGGFVENVAPFDTQITQRITPLPDNSKEEVYYVIRQGDNLSSVAQKFGLKLATIKYVNDIDNVNTVKPGTRLKISVRGYEVPAALIAKKDKDKAAKLAAASAAKRNTTTRSSATVKLTSSAEYTANSGGVSLIVPINGNGISQGFGVGGHTGVDYRANIGTPVVSAADGVVIKISTGWSGGYGNEIVVSHGDGVATRYGHLSQILVSPGDTVSQGQRIGLSGSTGRSTGPHLHFEKIVNGHTVKPF
ncbi:MAG: peptidoglycan DD-metalloendopeptidase family protein [Candidatus Berkelbacteria bacterium]